jgi:D-arabinose 5-phosphate isomerase GutQ
VVGDVTTRGIGRGDVLLVVSGSGETRGTVQMFKLHANLE